MPLSISFELNDQDLEHFATAQRSAITAAGNKSEEEIISASEKLLVEAQKTRIPDFVAQRLVQLDNLIAMLRDDAWALTDEDRKRVLSVLMYFVDPQDVIPDSVPVLGYLDDAIMIELCVRELKHEIEAYDDFCDFRQIQAQNLGVEPSSLGHPEWLEARREELQNRMHRRRDRDFGTGYGSSSGYSSGRSYVSNSWRPSIFRTS